MLAAGAADAMSREDLRRGYFTGALLEQLPRDTRGLPPNIDLLQALRAGVEYHTGRRQEPPFVGVYGTEAELRLPAASGKPAQVESRGRVGRQRGQSSVARRCFLICPRAFFSSIRRAFAA